jgi:hypothetical protein
LKVVEKRLQLLTLIFCFYPSHFFSRSLTPHSSLSLYPSGSNRDAEEAAIAIISQLIIRLHDCSEDNVSQRLLNKLTENGAEKLERCAELCAKYAKALLAAEKQIESTAEALKVHLIYFSLDFTSK